MGQWPSQGPKPITKFGTRYACNSKTPCYPVLPRAPPCSPVVKNSVLPTTISMSPTSGDSTSRGQICLSGNSVGSPTNFHLAHLRNGIKRLVDGKYCEK